MLPAATEPDELETCSSTGSDFFWVLVGDGVVAIAVVDGVTTAGVVVADGAATTADALLPLRGGR